MKKIIIILIILAILGGGGYYYYQNVYLPAQKPTLEVEKNSAQISKYYIYGTHLNLEGEIKKINANFEDLDLVMWNAKTGKLKKFEINYKKNVNNVNFNISDEINNGIYLDNIAKGNYRLYLRFKYEESKKDSDKKETTYKYYPLDNTTTYDETTYYTTSKQNKKITISQNKTTMTVKIKDNTDDVYDVVLDPSCGGVDKGATGNGVYESDITLEMANKVKEKLESKDVKVKLTRTEDSLSDSDYFDEYNDGGRAVISHEVKAKYLFSFQASSSTNPTINGLV